MTQTTTRRPRRSRDEIIAALEEKLQLRRNAQSKARRRDDARVKVMLGGYVLSAAKGGDQAAAELVDRWRASLKRGQDLELVERILGPAKPAPVDEVALQRAIDEAVAANKAAAAAGDDVEKSRTYNAWRHAIAAFERATGKPAVNPENRAKHKLGELGQLL